MEKTIKVVMVEPLKRPYVAEIENSLAGMQSVVNGYIEVITLEENVILVCNEEGKLLDLPNNRSLGNDILVGTFFVAGSNDSGDFSSLAEDKLWEYRKRFYAW